MKTILQQLKEEYPQMIFENGLFYETDDHNTPLSRNNDYIHGEDVIESHYLTVEKLIFDDQYCSNLRSYILDYFGSYEEAFKLAE